MAKIVCVFVFCVFSDDPADECHPADARDGLPLIDLRPLDQTLSVRETSVPVLEWSLADDPRGMAIETVNLRIA
jgi:hypothetical protein